MQKPKQLVYQYICWDISLVGGTFAAVGTRFKKALMMAMMVVIMIPNVIPLSCSWILDILAV